MSELKGFIQGLNQATYVGTDSETTGLSVTNGKDYLMGFSLAYEVGSMMYSQYFPVNHQEDNYDKSVINEVIDILKTKTLIFFNRKFDLHSFMTIGVDLSEVPAFDGMLMAHMINEERPYAKTLEACGQMYLKRGKVQKDEIDKFTKVFGWKALSPSVISKYACGDAELTLALWNKLESQFEKEFDSPERLWHVELSAQTVLFRIEQRGIKIDVDFCNQMANTAEYEMNEIEDELGFSPSKTTELSKFIFDELKLPVLDYTPKGKPALTKVVMEEYDRLLEDHSDDRARKVLEYRGWQKASSSFYTPIPKLVDSRNRVHCSFKQHGTATGRLSCAGPNFQQIPRNSENLWSGRARNMFLPSEGFKLVSLDYSQLELRLAAAYGNETLLIEEFAKDDADPFEILAQEVGVSRYIAKTMTYGLLYGAGLEKLGKILGRHPSEVEHHYKKFLASIPGIIKVKQHCETTARAKGAIRYWSGRKRHFNNRDDAYKAFNSLLQGGAAEIVKSVMIDCERTFDANECRLLLQIHDELQFEIVEDKVDYYVPKIKSLMEDPPTKHFGVRFKVSEK